MGDPLWNDGGPKYTIPGDAYKKGGYIWDKKAMVQLFDLGPNSSQAFDRGEEITLPYF
jgi:hypothetical protein